jgi:hypothetical protein
VLIGLGRLLTSRGAAAEAEPYLRRAVTTRSARLGERDPRTAEAQVWLGACLATLGRTAETHAALSAAHTRLRDEPHFRREAQEAAHLLSASSPAIAR